MVDHSENGKTTLNLSVSTDGGEFHRHTCTSCGLDFKTDISGGQLAHRLAEEVAFVGETMGQSVSPMSGDLDRTVVHCPYCRYPCEPEDLITEERFEYIRGVIYDLYVRPAVDRLLSSFNGSGGTGGLLSIRLKSSTSVPPPLPLEGPEPPDMVPVSLLCCGRRVKVLPKWTDMESCPYCTTPIRVR